MTTIYRIIFFVLFIFGAILIFIASAHSANAQPICDQHDNLEAALAQRFDEYLFVRAASSQESMVEVYVSKKGTWTITITGLSHISCIADAGDGWELAKPKGDPT